jgi:CRISPR-associated endonuclease/helicase Cas3
MLDSLHSYLADLQSKSEKTDINTKRNELLDNCIQAAGMRSGLFTLTAPTGSGKTISSVAFALTHAIKNNQRRIFYVVPYNTIIEQNAGVFESVFGAENVIQHHSGMSYEADELDPNNNEQRRKLLATENWDAPLIVTSSVRFFESLYGNKPSICRKLHNISNSVIVLDEAQMIPLPYLKPCVAALRDLVMHYDCSVVLATATQPSLNKYFQPLTPVEIVLKPDEMHEFFKRVSIEIIPDTLANEDIINLMLSHDQVLCVVNTRKRAQEIAEQLGDCSFHLSTTMAPVHRSQVLNEIRILLKQGDICRVVSTSLVEAGVDVDFPTVYREKAGLDSIIQVAGRCNREGRYSSAVSKVFVFTAEGSSQRSIAQNISAYELVARSHDDISSPEATRDYFEQLRYMIGDENLDDNSVVSRFNSGRKTLSFPFKEIARSFKLIDDETKTIIVPFDDNVITLVNRLRFGERSRNLFRAIQQYSVSIYENELKRLNEIGAIEHIDEEILIIQDTYYDSRFGVTLAPEGGLALFG